MLLLFKAFITSILFNLEPSSNLAPGFIRLSSAATGTVVVELGKEGAKPYLGLNFPAFGIQIHASGQYFRNSFPLIATLYFDKLFSVINPTTPILMVLLTYNFQLLGVEQNEKPRRSLQCKGFGEMFFDVHTAPCFESGLQLRRTGKWFASFSIGYESASWKAEEAVIAQNPESFIFEYSTKSIYC